MKKRIISIATLIMTLPVLLSGCSSDDKKVVVASKPMTSQYIVSEMIASLIEENTDIKVERKLGIGGGTSNIHPAMLKGEIDIYPEYTGTGWLFVLKENKIEDQNKLYEEVKKRYSEEFGIKWMDLYGFNDTYAVVVTKETANKYNLKTISDLEKYSKELVYGANPDFYEREDGFNAFTKEYGLDFKSKKELDIALKVDALKSKEIDVTNVTTVDPKLTDKDLVVLEDDRNYFPSYYATTLVREETLNKYPEIEKELEKLTNQISEEDIIKLSYDVEYNKKDPKDVAENFLKEKGLIK